MLRNEKYMGDALLQKTYTVDFMTKKKVKNTGIVPQYYVEDDHEAIIPKELFYRVQEEMMRRASLCKAAVTRKKNQKSRYSSTYALTGMLICGKCGQEYRRVTWARNGKKKVVWRCSNRLTNGVKKCASGIWKISRMAITSTLVTKTGLKISCPVFFWKRTASHQQIRVSARPKKGEDVMASNMVLHLLSVEQLHQKLNRPRGNEVDDGRTHNGDQQEGNGLRLEDVQIFQCANCGGDKQDPHVFRQKRGTLPDLTLLQNAGQQQNQQQDQADHAGRDHNGQQRGNALSGHADQE